MIFGKWAKKYWEMGFSVIPIRPASKRAFLDNWTVYCEKLPTEEEIDSWCRLYPNNNIGITLGRASGLIALDIDTDDIEVLSAFPKSQAIRRGKKGQARFFKYVPGVASRRQQTILNSQMRFPVEIMSVGTQLIVPPSIHPDTGKEYIWLPEHDIFKAELEPFPHETVKELLKRFESSTEWIDRVEERHAKLPQNHILVTGRNDFLKKHCHAMVCSSVPKDIIIKELIELDLASHPANPLFQDANENVKPEKFVDNIIRSYEKNTQSSYVPYNDYKIIESSEITIESQTFKESEGNLPNITNVLPFRGIMRDIYEHLYGMGDKTPLASVALGGAISILATFVCRKFAMKYTTPTGMPKFEVWPNTYSLVLAPSGMGKSFPYTFLKNQLCAAAPELSRVIGETGYGSGNALLVSLKDKPARLDILNEATTTIKSLDSKKGKIDLKVSELLIEIFDNAASFVEPPVSISNLKSKMQGRYNNPCVNILASTTFAGFEEHADIHQLRSGFWPRFLFFAQKIPDPRRLIPEGRDEYEARFNKIKGWLSGLFQIPEITPDNLVVGNTDFSAPVVPRYIKISKNMLEKLDQMEDCCISFQSSVDENSPLRYFYNRRFQHILKLALLYEVSIMPCDAINFRDQARHKEFNWELHEESIDWAWRFMEVQSALHRYLSTDVEQTSNEYGKSLKRVFDRVKTSENGISKSDLFNKLRNIPTRDLDDLLNRLRVQGLITALKFKTNRRHKTVYCLVNEERSCIALHESWGLELCKD